VELPQARVVSGASIMCPEQSPVPLVRPASPQRNIIKLLQLHYAYRKIGNSVLLIPSIGLEGEHVQLGQFKPRERRYEQFGKPATRVRTIESVRTGREADGERCGRAVNRYRRPIADWHYYTRILENHNSYILVTF
jgi:hypothetical protein